MAAGELFQGDAAFESGEGRAEAAVDAEGERQVPGGVGPGDVEPVRVGEHGGVPVGAAEGGDDGGTLRDQGAVHFCVLCRDAGRQLGGAVVAEEFLDRAGGERRVGCERPPLRGAGLGQQRDGAVADEVHGGLEPGDEDEQRGGDELALGEPVAVFPGGDEGGQQAVVGVSPALFREVAQVGGQCELRREALVPGGPGGLRVEGGGGLVAPGAELRLVFRRDAEQVADHRYRERERERVDEVELSGPGRVQQPSGLGTDPRFQGGGCLGGERAGHEPADAGVVGRVEGEQVGVGVVPRRAVAGLVDRAGAEPAVSQHRRHGGVARRHPGPELAADHAALPDHGVQGVGVGFSLRADPAGDRVAAPGVPADHRRLEEPAHHCFCEAHAPAPSRSAGPARPGAAT